jgi:peptidyl-dipeptidase Dcp
MSVAMQRIRKNSGSTLLSLSALSFAAALLLNAYTLMAQTADSNFGPGNPFYAASTLPFQAPPFDKIKNSDYQPAIDAGMAEQRREMQAIADNPAPPTFDNTIVAMEKSGELFTRVYLVFNGITSANLNPELQKVQDYEAPRLAAFADDIFLNAKLFQRVAKLYQERDSLHLDPEARRLLEIQYRRFVHAGANLNDADKTALKKLNEEDSTLQNAFTNKLLAAAKAGAYVTPDKASLAGLTDAQIAGAAEAAKDGKVEGYVIPLQNTTQQPTLAELTQRPTRQAIFENSLNRAERNDANDTRGAIVRLAQLRAQKAKLLGFPTYAAWALEDQMAKTPEAALKFMDALVSGATSRAAREAADIQGVIDSQHGGFKASPGTGIFIPNRSAKRNTTSTKAKSNLISSSTMFFRTASSMPRISFTD